MRTALSPLVLQAILMHPVITEYLAAELSNLDQRSTSLKM
jgi:hypothetical protein